MQAQGLWIQPESLGIHSSFKGFRCRRGSEEKSGRSFGAQHGRNRPAEGDY